MYFLDVLRNTTRGQWKRSVLEGGSYEEVIRLAISLGGDADTQACMAGSIAEAFGYEIPDRFLGRLYRCADDMLEMIVKFNEKLREKENGAMGN